MMANQHWPNDVTSCVWWVNRVVACWMFNCCHTPAPVALLPPMTYIILDGKASIVRLTFCHIDVRSGFALWSVTQKESF